MAAPLLPRRLRSLGNPALLITSLGLLGLYLGQQRYTGTVPRQALGSSGQDNDVTRNTSLISVNKDRLKTEVIKEEDFSTLQVEGVPDVKVPSVDCRRLFTGDKNYVHSVLDHNMSRVPNALSLLQTQDCAEFRRTRQYPMVALSQEEAAFPIAFSLVFYKEASRVERLLRAIYQPQNFYCLHVDAKASQALRDVISALVQCFPNVIIASSAVSVVWGHISVLQAELICMKDLLAMGSRWKYFINLTGQEFPLKTNLELVRILRVYHGANDIYGESPKSSSKYFHRVKYMTKLLSDGVSWKKTPMTKGPLPYNITFIKGRVHITASRAFVNFAVNNHIAKDFAQWLVDTAIPDETFFPVLQYNSHLGAPGALDIFTGQDLQGSSKMDYVNRFKIFKAHSKYCGGKFHREICIFGIKDLPQLYHNGVSSTSLFANKFHEDFQPLAYDCLEELHYNRTRQGVMKGYTQELNIRAYEHLSFVEIYNRRNELINGLKI